jgi:hypothetical protein
VLVRRAAWIVPLLLVLLVLSRRPSVARDMTPLALHLSERFGTTNLTYTTQGESKRLELLLTGKRWHGLNNVVPDSARVVARYALANLQGIPRPDSIVVTIRTTYKWGGMVHGSSGVHMGVGEL